jgi:hypothetical protein
MAPFFSNQPRPVLNCGTVVVPTNCSKPADVRTKFREICVRRHSTYHGVTRGGETRSKNTKPVRFIGSTTEKVGGHVTYSLSGVRR